MNCRSKAPPAFLSTLFLAAVLLALAASLPATLEGQQRLRIDDPVTLEYEVALQEIVNLPVDLAEAPLPAAVFAAASENRYFVGPTLGDRLAVFDGSGSLVTTLSLGESPAPDPRSLSDLEVDDEGTIHALRGDRVLRIDASALSLEGVVELGEPVFSLRPVGESGYLVVPSQSELARMGRQVRRLAIAGNRIVGQTTMPLPPSAPLPVDGSLLERLSVVAPASAVAFWSAPMHEYVLDLVGAGGEVLQSLERRADWFPPGVYNLYQPFMEPPTPMIIDLDIDEEGRVWILIRVASATWEPRETPSVEEFDRSARFSDYFDTIVEVIDPDALRVVARERIEGMARFLPGTPNGIWRSRVLPSGQRSVQMLALGLRESAMPLPVTPSAPPIDQAP